MNKLIQLFVDKKRATLMLLLVIVLLGYVAFIKIPKESSPDVAVPFIYVLLQQQGISPEDAQKLLLKPIENALRTVVGIKEMTSYAEEGFASIIVEFEAGLDIDKALNDVRNKVSDTEHKLPIDAEKPVVQEVNLSLEPVLNVILRGDLPERALLQAARDLKDVIEEVPGVLEVSIRGDKEEALEIVVEPKILENYGLPIQLLSSAIDGNNRLIPAGSVKSTGGVFPVKIPSLVKNFEELMRFPIMATNDFTLRLGDVAEVRSTYKDAASIARVNGKPAVVLEVSKRSGANIINTVAAVKGVIEAAQGDVPEQLEIIYSKDESSNIKDVLSDLENSLIIASILVVIIIMLVVGVRASLLIALSIPASFLTGILILDLMGYTLNIVALFSLILTVGMIVDDAIVVSEYADRKIIEGMPVHTAFVHAATRMFWPIVTSTLVKIAVFLPLLFWPGVLGQFMKYLPITVIFILSNSLLFALFFQPSLGPLFGESKVIDPEKIKAMRASEEGSLEELDKFSKLYMVSLLKVLERPKLFASSVAGGLVVVYFFFFNFGTGVEFFPKVEPTSAVVSIGSPGNLSIEQKDRIMKEVETALFQNKEGVKTFYTKSGSVNGQSIFPQDTIGVVQVEFEDWKARPKAAVIVARIREQLRHIKGISYQVLESRAGPSSQKPIEIDFSAKDYGKLVAFVGQVRAAMGQMGGFEDIEDSRPIPAIEWHLLIDREIAARYKVDIGAVGNMVQLVTSGLKISKYRPDDTDEEVDILLRFPQDRRVVSTLDTLRVVNSEGKAIPISTFMKKVPAPQVSQIKRVDQKVVITVKANVAEGILVDDKVKELQKWTKENALKNMKVKFKGDSEDQQESGQFLVGAFILALLTMFIIMLVQFNNFYHTCVIMSAVFLSTVGVLLGLIITWQPFGVVMCGIGIIALAGIVLNNNIIFVDTYHHLREQGFEVKEAVVKTGVQRLRPILLTASTAILGLLPMVFGITINFFEREVTYDAPASQWWRQLSAAIAGGLTFATILTLFFTPCLLLLGEKLDSVYQKGVNV